jgi:molybdopterin synthase sulfur carrier subunit
VATGFEQVFCAALCHHSWVPEGDRAMPVKVMIPTPLRAYAGKRDSAEFSASTVGEALGHLTTQFADLRKHLFTEEGKLRSFVNVYVNDEDIRYLAKENTPTKDGDTISIVPSIAGGCVDFFKGTGESQWLQKYIR